MKKSVQQYSTQCRPQKLQSKVGNLKYHLHLKGAAFYYGGGLKNIVHIHFLRKVHEEKKVHLVAGWNFLKRGLGIDNIVMHRAEQT